MLIRDSMHASKHAPICPPICPPMQPPTPPVIRARTRSHHRGMALATVAIILLLLGALAFAGVRMLADHRLITSAYAQREHALRAAEYALTQAEHEVGMVSAQALRDMAVASGGCGTGIQAGYCAGDTQGHPGWSFARFRKSGAEANTRAAGNDVHPPRYVLELMPDRHPGTALSRPGTYGAVPAVIYRVTAAGFSQDGGMARMLQTLVRPAPYAL